MRLFKYCSPQTGQRILDGQSLRFSPVSAFNDPFDSLAGTGILDTKKFRHQLIDIRIEKQFEPLASANPGIPRPSRKELEALASVDLGAAIAENKVRLFEAIRRKRGEFRILCLSQVPPEDDRALLLWGHYTGNKETKDGHESTHAGFALEFDGAHEWFRAQPMAKAVAYPKTLVRPSATFTPPNQFRIPKKSVFRKSFYWKYEQEYRLLRAQTDPELDRTSCDSLLKFPSDLLVGVTFGLNTPTEMQQEIREICRAKYAGIRFRRVREIDPSQFRLIVEDLNP